MDTSLISKQISAFRTLSTEAAISPEVLGVVLQALADLIAKAAPVTDLSKLFKVTQFQKGLLATFDSSEDLNSYLNGLVYNSLESGRYVVLLGGVPVYITFALLHQATKKAALWVEGSLMVTDDKVSSNSGTGVTIAYRYYSNEAWSNWLTICNEVKATLQSHTETLQSQAQTLQSQAQTLSKQEKLLDSLNTKANLIPTKQTSATGTDKNFIFSASNVDPMRTVLCSRMWLHKHTDGNLFLRVKHWGAANSTTDDRNYSQVLLQMVTNNEPGIMNPYVYARLMNNTLSESGSTPSEVHVTYSNFEQSGTKTFIISQATPLKAGVMTAEHCSALERNSADISMINATLQSFFDSITEQAVRIAKLEAEVKNLKTTIKN